MSDPADEREPPNWGLRIALGLLGLCLAGASTAVWYVSSRDFTLPFDQPEPPRPDQPQPQARKAADGHLVSPPGWRRQPDGDTVARYYPGEARRRHVAGRVLLHCAVGLDGRMSGCSPISETPPGWGFGAAAKELSGELVMWPRTVDGKPVPGEVRIPINFTLDDQ